MTSTSNAQAADAHHEQRPSFWKRMTEHAWWPWAVRLAKLAFFSLVAYLLYTQAREIEWDKVLKTVRQYPLQTLLIAAGFAAGSHILYSSFDLLGRHYTGHRLSAPQVMLYTFISYAFNLNFGSLIGGVAFRYRLYSRACLEAATTTRVLFISMLTNWLGYLLLAGLVFCFRPFPLPPDWKLSNAGLQILGVVLLATTAAYLLLCAFSRKRTWALKGHEFELPTFRFALLQLAMSCLNWILIATTVYTLLDSKIAFTTVLGVMLVGAIAGVITHVPAGLGVLEAVFIALLSHQIPKSDLLAGLLMYRAIYYLAPLSIATVLYLTVEARARAAGENACATQRE